MAKTLHRLTALQVHRAKQGKHNDGGNLYLYVHAGGSRSWVFRYGPQGKHEHGLGPVHTVSITAARERARACREMLLNSIDPIAERKARKSAAKGTAARTMSFSACADAYFAAHKRGLEEREACYRVAQFAGGLCCADHRQPSSAGR